MSWLYLPAAAADCLPADCLAGEPSATLSASPTASKSSRPASVTAISMTGQSGTTLRPSTGNPGLDMWTLSLVDFPASPTATPGSGPAPMTAEISGLTHSASFAQYDPNGACWRTSQLSLLTTTSKPYSEAWPKAGLILRGIAFRLHRSARRMAAIGFGLWPTPTVPNGGRQPRGGMSRTGMTLDGKKRQVDLFFAVKQVERAIWPTPRAVEWKANEYQQKGKHKWLTLTGAVRQWPTPHAEEKSQHNSRDNGMALSAAVTEDKDGLLVGPGGSLNPPWVEWLMGWPIGWTDCAPLATDRFHSWLQQHGDY